MLEPPDIPTDQIISTVAQAFGLPGVRAVFLPIGLDNYSAVYRLDAPDGTAYFLKLRRGEPNENMVAVPHFLKQSGVPAIVAPLPTQEGGLWAPMGAYRLVLYPFIPGQDGFQASLSPRQRVTFGAALRAIHTADLPPQLREHILREDFSPRSREQMRAFLGLVETRTFQDETSQQLAALIRAQRAEILRVVDLASELARALQANLPPFVLCHADIHPGNLLLGPDDSLTIVDWDFPVYAPKERDLMFVEEPGSPAADLFFQGYGPTQIDPLAMAYYHYERLTQDLAAFSEQILETSQGGQDREQALVYFSSIFLPENSITLADRAFSRLPR